MRITPKRFPQLEGHLDEEYEHILTYIGGGGPFIDAELMGLCKLIPPVFRRFAIEGKDVGPDPFCEPGIGGAAVGGLGAAMGGGLGAELMEVSGSDV